MEGWPKKVRVYFWKSGLWRESVTRQLGVDFEVYTRELIAEKASPFELGRYPL